MADTTSPPVDKAEKYDRQIRLWGTEGQQRIEKASVACLNATAATTETLKNLVLPGVGSYTIVDNGKVTNQDLGNNFFVTIDSVGKSKATVCCELLQELNSDVTGNSMSENPVTIIDENLNWFNQFTIVLVANIPTASLQKLAAHLFPLNIPLLVITSVGLLGCIRIQIKEHTIIESKPDNSLPDLRITAPWDELKNYCEKIELNELDNEAHGHIPYIVILYQALQEWKVAHGGNPPGTYKEKQEFKNFVMQGKRSDDEGNYTEVYNEVKNAWLLPDIPESVQELLQSSKCTEQNASPFWLCILALKQFVSDRKYLPLSGSLPDMSSDTVSYQTIQALYKEKAERDYEAMSQYVSDVCKVAGRARSDISEDFLRLVCKNAQFIRCVSTRSIEQEMEVSTDNGLKITEAIECDMYGTPKWYLLLRGYQRFQTNYNRAPGMIEKDLDADLIALKNYCAEVCKELGVSSGLVSDEAIQELCRFGGGEIHTISATLGGIAAQESIKLITAQLVPFNNTYILDGITCNSTTFEV